MSLGPPPFIYHHIAHEAVPESGKEALGTLSGGQLCFVVATIALVGFAASWAIATLLDRLSKMHDDGIQPGR